MCCLYQTKRKLECSSHFTCTCILLSFYFYFSNKCYKNTNVVNVQHIGFWRFWYQRKIYEVSFSRDISPQGKVGRQKLLFIPCAFAVFPCTCSRKSSATLQTGMIWSAEIFGNSSNFLSLCLFCSLLKRRKWVTSKCSICFCCRQNGVCQSGKFW